MAGKFMSQIDKNTVGATIQMCVDKISSHPEIASLLCVYSGIDKDGIMCAHHLMNPHTVATVLVNEAITFNRAKEVLKFIRQTRDILDIAEANINDQLSIQSAHN